MNIRPQPKTVHTVQIKELNQGDAFAAEDNSVAGINEFFILTDEDWKAVNISDGTIHGFDAHNLVTPLPKAEFLANL